MIDVIKNSVDNRGQMGTKQELSLIVHWDNRGQSGDNCKLYQPAKKRETGTKRDNNPLGLSQLSHPLHTAFAPEEGQKLNRLRFD